MLSFVNYTCNEENTLKVRHYRKHFYSFFIYMPFPIKMLATDAKTQKIETGPNLFYDRRMFRRQNVNIIDTT